MSFISGLKGVFKQPIYVFTIIIFIIIWILILYNIQIGGNELLSILIIIFGGGLILFNIILFALSFFKPIHKIGKILFIISFTIAIIIAFIFTEQIFLPTFQLFFLISINVNLFFTAFFAFKLCMDSSTKIDDYLYSKGKSGKFLRIIEFALFGFLSWWLLRATWNLFRNNFDLLAQIAAAIFRIILWVDIILAIIVFLRLIFIKKFAAYITLFFLLTFFYILYLIFDFLYGVFFSHESGDLFYTFLTFIIDLLLFLYIIGVIYDRTDYLQKKIKVLRIDTIALFLIIMKMYVQFAKIIPRPGLDPILIAQEYAVLIIFLFFTFLFGIHSIFVHKPKYSKK